MQDREEAESLTEEARIARFYRLVIQRKGWLSDVAFALFAGLPKMAVSRLRHGIYPTSSIEATARYCYATDTPLDVLAEQLGLDHPLKERMQDPKYRHMFLNLRYLEDSAAARSPLEQILAAVPDERKSDTRGRIMAVIREASK